MINGKRLAFDYGSVRIGVALSDQSGILASPLDFISNDESVLSNIREVINANSPIYIALGIPKHLSGNSGSKFEEVMDFLEKIRANFSGPIYEIDERFTTVSAAAKLRESGKSAKDSKNLIDSAAAVAILESAIEIERAGGLDKCEL